MSLAEDIDLSPFGPMANINLDAQLQPTTPMGFLNILGQPNAEILCQNASLVDIGSSKFDLMRDVETAAAMSELQL